MRSPTCRTASPAPTTGSALGIVPTYIVRQLLLTVLMAGAYFGGLPVDAVTAMVLSAAAIWLPALLQMVVLNRRLSTTHRARTEGA